LAAAILGGTKPRRGLNDAAIACLDLVRRYRDGWERPLTYSRAGRELVKLGFREDLREAALMDAYPVLPLYHERRVTLAAVPV
jgi:phosphosulfolactate phosphohydrolase-like enzyme